MRLNSSIIGWKLPSITVQVERGRLRSFAAVTGQDDPIYSDETAARSVGHPDLPVPPTFLFGLGLEGPEPFRYLDELGIDLSLVLHGEQEFHYHRMAYVGDELTFTPMIADVYEKKGGALRFLVRRTSVTRECELVAEMIETIVIRVRTEDHGQ